MPRTLKLWEGKYSMRTMMLITIMVLLTMTMAKSEEAEYYDLTDGKKVYMQKKVEETDTIQ